MKTLLLSFILLFSNITYADWFFPYVKVQCSDEALTVLNLSEWNLEGDTYDNDPTVISEKHLLAYGEGGELIKNTTHQENCELNGILYLVNISASDGWDRPATMVISVSSPDGQLIKSQGFNQSTLGQGLLIKGSQYQAGEG